MEILFDMALNDRGYKIGLGRQHIQMNDMPLEKSFLIMH